MAILAMFVYFAERKEGMQKIDGFTGGKMKDTDWCCNCVYCNEISPYQYLKEQWDEEYQGYCSKKGIYLLTIDDRVCTEHEEDLRNESHAAGNV